MSQPPPALGISIGRDQLVASAYLQSHNAAVVACPPTPAIVALAPREDGSLHLECGAGGELLRFDERPGVVLHPKQLLGVPFGSPAAQAYAAGHPATKLVQRQGDLCVELELEDWVKQERTQHGLTESTMTLRPPDIVAALVADVKRRAEAQLGMGITRAVITVPPFFQDTQRQQTKDAGTLAGLQVLRIINEPTAAALAYGIDRLSNSRELHALVFNMGATTLTATALSIEDGVFEVRATRAIDLGGAQFVENMAEHCASQFQQLHGIDLRPIARSMTRIRRVCRRAMEALSQQVQVPIEVDWVHRESELDLQYTMSRARFELINNALFEQALAEADAVLRDAKIRPDQIEHVVLSGGCCNMPKIPAMFKAHLPRATVHNSIKPEEVEAYGAATQAAILCGPAVTSWWEMAPAPFWNIAGAGLYHERTCLSLTASQVDVSIVDTRAEVTVTQSFINTTTNPLETTYVYPVEEGSAVFAFSADIDGRSIHAVVKEKQQAKEEYEDAISSGHGAYLLQELTGDIFQINVGNLPAGSVATIKISYACDLPLEGNDLRFSLPTFSSSKYVPQGSQTEGSTNSSVATVDAVTDITVNCTTASPLVSISSPTHPGIVTDVQGCSARVTLTASLAKEFVLKIEETAPRAPRVWIETNDDDGEPSRAAAVTLYPEFPSNSSTTSGSLPVEIVFLLDRSGSMSGSAIKQARDALMLFLKSLPGGHVSFNIVGFGSSHETLFESSVAYDDASLQKAQQHVLSLDADLGGTEILRPLEEIFRVPEKPGVPRQVILLTDGEVSNTEQVIQFVKQHSKNTRVFTLGIGAGASHRLIKGMAHAGRGSYEFVASGERIAGKVMRQLRNALQPFMTEATVSWGSLVVRDAVPQTIGPLYSGQKLTLFALLDKNSPHDADAEVRFEAQSSEGRVACSARLGGSSRGRLLHTLAAKTIISELEEEAKSPQLIDERRQQIRAHILDTSLRYGVASSEASFVAVEEREDATEGTMLSAVPEMTSCVGGAAPQKMVKTQRTSSSVNDVLLIDVCPLSLGFDVADTGLMRPVILRNTTIPCRKIQTCRALVPADGQLRFAIFEGERPLASDNSRLGELTLSLPHLANAEVPVEVTFDLDANGILHVLVLEKTTATRERLVITNDKGRLSVAEIERMVREAEAAKTADDELRRIIEAQCGGGVSAGSVAHRVTPFDQNIATASHAVKSLFAQLDERRMKKAAELEAQYIHLIALQKANGEWPLTPELCEVLRFDVKQHCPPLPMQLEPRTADTVVATLAALAFLSERVADRSEEWALLAAKANTRLLDHLLVGLAYRADVQQVIEATTAEIRRAMAANLTEAEQADAAIMTRANSVLNAVSGQLAELQDLLRSFTVAPPESPAPNAAPAPRAPTIEEVD